MKHFLTTVSIMTAVIMLPSACTNRPVDAGQATGPGNAAAGATASAAPETKPKEAKPQAPDLGDDILAQVMQAKREQREAIARGEGGFPVQRANETPEWTTESDFVGVKDTTASGASSAMAKPVPGKPGFVFSPFNNKVLNVKGLPSGTLVADPTYPRSEKKFFRVP